VLSPVFTAGALAAGAFQMSGPRLTGHAAFSWHMVPAGLYLALQSELTAGRQRGSVARVFLTA
jgi:hypothetical protein